MNKYQRRKTKGKKIDQLTYIILNKLQRDDSKTSIDSKDEDNINQNKGQKLGG